MAEFNRISGKNLQTEFFQKLDRFTPRFIDIFRAKGGDIGSKLKKILQQIENDVSSSTYYNSFSKAKQMLLLLLFFALCCVSAIQDTFL